ncbi:MAG: FaeA/PapI family transcriptional regulator [Acidobacteriota bacterium]
MARKRQAFALTAPQARYILEKLIDEGKVDALDVRRHLAGMWEEMTILQKRVAELRGFVEPAKHPVHTAKVAVKDVARAVRRRSRKISEETRASYQLQGQYLGYMRQIPEQQRAKYKRLARDEGRETAVAAMKKVLGK